MTLEEMRRAKERNGYSMAQLSERSGVPLGTLQKIFSGETRHPRYKTLRAIEQAFADARKEDGWGRDPIGGAAGDMGETEMYFYDWFGHKTEPDLIREAAVSYGTQRRKRQGEYTVDDYYTLPQDVRVELIDGVIYDMAAPGFVHQRIAAALLFQINAYIREKGGNCIPLAAPLNVRLDCDDRTMVQPDLIILCDQGKIKRWGVMGAPDFILEVVSRSTRKRDYTKKLQKYTDAGVKEYWIVDPEKKMLITYDFINWDIPRIQPLEGKAGLALYGGDLQVDLDEVAVLIQEWPE